jgi:DNA gyrase subunit A
MRYTEVRMTKLTHELLADLEKDTVDWEDNYDGSERIPQVLPTRVPNLLSMVQQVLQWVWRPTWRRII